MAGRDPPLQVRVSPLRRRTGGHCPGSCGTESVLRWSVAQLVAAHFVCAVKPGASYTTRAPLGYISDACFRAPRTCFPASISLRTALTAPWARCICILKASSNVRSGAELLHDV